MFGSKRMMRLVGVKIRYLILMLLVTAVRLTCADLTFGAQNGIGKDYSENLLNATLAYLGNELNTSVNLLIMNDEDLSSAVLNGTVQIAYAGAGFLSCLQVLTDVRPLVSIVQAANGTPVYQQAGAIYTRAASNITTIQQVIGKTIASGAVTQFTGFQAQVGSLLKNGINIFSDARGILIGATQLDVLQAVLDGTADIGFAGPNAVNTYYSSGALPTNSLQVLGARPQIGYPYQVSTDLYPNAVMLSKSDLDRNITARVISALLALTSESPETTQGGYYGWTGVDNYLPVLGLQTEIGVYEIGQPRCNNISTLTSAIVCPPGQQIIANLDPAERCMAQSVRCPTGFDCVCTPCVPIARNHIGLLPTSWFIIVIVIPVVFVIGALIALWRYRKVSGGSGIPYKELNVDPDVKLGRARQGLVRKGTYKDELVSIKRAFPKQSTVKSIFDVDFRERDSSLLNESPFFHRRGFLMRHVHRFVAIIKSIFGIITPEARCRQCIMYHSKMRHPNLLKIVGWSGGHRGEEILLVRQYVSGESLFELLHNPSVDVTNGFAASLARDIAQGLSFLHKQNPPGYGRNLRSHHLFIGESYRCMIGLSFNPQQEGGRALLMLAPEVLRGEEPTQESDIYSFGMLIFEIFHRHDVFHDEDPETVVKAVLDLGIEEPKRPKFTKANIPIPVKDLICSCWHEDTRLRPQFLDIISVLDKFASTSITQTLMLEQRQTNALLNKMLPEHAVKALQEGRRPSAHHFDMVTVYFSDIKNFTTMSSVQSSEEVMRMLDDLYTRLDNLGKFHGLMKVETTGDSWMGVAGLAEEQPDHAARVARFAVDAIKEANSVRMAGVDDCVHIRSGFHSGPVSSGVVGTDKPRFSLFGDTINTASRMESTGEPDRIQMSQVAAGLVTAQDPSLTSRVIRRAGDIEVKGKGPMQTYWLYTDDDLARKQRKITPSN